MSQPYAPLSGLPGFGAGAPAPLTGLPGFAPAPQAVQQPGGPVGSLPPSLRGTGVEAYDRANPASDAGPLETVATQAGRGLLDAVLSSGALTGAAAEAVGSAAGWKGLEDFGRDLGRSSSGAAAMEATAFLFGGGGQKGLTYADRVDRAIAEQEQAWPLLSAVSRIGGMASVGLAGGLSGVEMGAAATLRGAVGLGAYEGAAGGVQAAYERNEALRDVLVSGLAGATLGAGAGAAVFGVAQIPGKIGQAIDERNVVKQIFGDVKSAADDVAEAVRDAGGREVYDAAKVVLKERARVLQEVAAAGDNPSLIRQAYDKATRAAGERISALAGDFDATSWARKSPTVMQKLLHRTPLLDQVSADVAGDVARLEAARPAIDFDLRVPRKLLRDADGTAAIGGLQTRLTQAIEQAPDGAVRRALLPFSERLGSADAVGAMSAGHDLVRSLNALSHSAADPVAAAYAKRTAQAIADELGGEAWGSAGKAYRAMTRLDSPLDNLDQRAVRDALKHADSSRALPGAIAEQNEQLIGAYAARKQLGGEYMDPATKKLLGEAAERAEKAHAAVTFDGAPARRVLDVLSGAGRNIGESYASDLLGMGVGAAVGGIPGMLVARALAPVLGDVASAAFGKGVRAAGERAGKQFGAGVVAGLRQGTSKASRAAGWQQATYRENLDKLAGAVSAASPETDQRDRAIASLPPELQARATVDMQSKLEQLLADLPKPQPNIRGPEFEALSRQDLRRAQAMWEATMRPMSVFSDFAAGVVDYDKVRYAWKQYPGLQQAAQAGLVDIIETQLSKDSKARMSDGILTQLDNLFGFEGTLQPTNDRQFGARMSALGAAQAQQQPAPQRPGPSRNPSPLQQPTFTQRLTGQKA